MKYKTTQAQISENILSHEGTVGGFGGIVGHFSLGRGNMDTTNFYTKQEVDLMMQDKVVMKVYTIYDLPSVGKLNTLYVVLSENAIYIWIEDTSTYKCVGKQSEREQGEYIKTYKSLAEINPSFIINTSVADVVLAMEDCSVAMYNTPTDDNGVYPIASSTIIISKQSDDRNYVQCSHPTDGVWYTSYNVNLNPRCEWKKFGETSAVEQKTNITSSMMMNDWTLTGYVDSSYVVTNKTVSLNLVVDSGILKNNATICTKLPKRNTGGSVPITLHGLNGTSHLMYYTSDGRIVTGVDISGLDGVGFINAIVHL